MPFNARNFTKNAVIIAATISVGAVFVVNGVIPNVQPKNFGEVEPGVLYRSGILTTAALESVVDEHNIELVIDLGGHIQGTDGDHRETRAAESLGIERVLLPLFGDGTGDPNQYAEALRRIRTSPGPVLVHCHAGAQRTGVAIILWRMFDQGWTLDEALTDAALYGHDPTDNAKLEAYVREWAAAIDESARSGVRIEYDGPTAVISP